MRVRDLEVIDSEFRLPCWRFAIWSVRQKVALQIRRG
jgi:hypothetical protein